MPIILPDQPSEHPDVTALKQQVREVAQKYASRHNWCREVNAALREAGINTAEEKVDVTIQFTVAGSPAQEATKRFNVNDLLGKTHEEQLAWIAEQIAPKVDVAGTSVTLPVTVLDANGEVKAADAASSGGMIRVHGLTYPTGYIHYYTSDDARVAHLLRHEWDQAAAETPAMETPVMAHARALREATNPTSIVYGICTQDASRTYYPQPTSRRSEYRICARCQAETER